MTRHSARFHSGSEWRLLAAIPLFAALVVLPGCSPADNDPGPGGVSVGEARALDEAAAMIEEKSTPPAPPPATPAGK